MSFSIFTMNRSSNRCEENDDGEIGDSLSHNNRVSALPSVLTDEASPSELSSQYLNIDSQCGPSCGISECSPPCLTDIIGKSQTIISQELPSAQVQQMETQPKNKYQNVQSTGDVTNVEPIKIIKRRNSYDVTAGPVAKGSKHDCQMFEGFDDQSVLFSLSIKDKYKYRHVPETQESTAMSTHSEGRLFVAR